MNCTAALQLMLEAEPAELEGTTDSELSRHLRECARCRAAARRILEAEGELARVLAAAMPRRRVDEAVREAARRARRRWVWRAVPLAAAATLAVLLTGRWHSEGGAPPQTVRRPSPPFTAAFAVQPPPGRSVAVFTTDNPDIVVIWFF